MRQRFGALVLAVLVGAVAIERADAIPQGKAAPEIAGSSWINSAPLTINDLKGRVVLVEFWTYG